MVQRPVPVQPWKAELSAVREDGTLTESFQRFLYQLWLRTGGFSDEFSTLATGSFLSQIGATERATSQVSELRNINNLLLGQVVGLSGFPPPTRVVTFEQNDVWRLNPDIRALAVFAVGGGGGGGGGTTGVNGGGGGGGANYSFAFIEGERLPASINVTVGAAGLGGSVGNDGTDGGSSSFGTFVAALGGKGGRANGIAGGINEVYGGMFQGGAGGGGTTDGDGFSAPNVTSGAPGGGGGASFVTNPGVGGSGGAGNGRTLQPTGGGGGGGIAGADGQDIPMSETLIGPGFGGGGGGGVVGASGAGGKGYNGAGGGGGGSRMASARAGGDGGSGKVWVLEYY